MAVMIVKAVKPNTAAEGKTFADNGSIAGWAEEAVKSATGNDLLTGYPDNTFRPKGNTTRAEAAVVLSKALHLKASDKEKLTPVEENYSLIDKAGTYGPATGTKTVEGNVTVKSPDVTLRNLIITGALIIAEEVGDGDVILDNVTVKGKTYIRGGGKDSIHINGGQYTEIIVEKTATGAVRIVATDISGLQVVIAENADGEQIILEGQFDNVTVQADNVNITTQGNTTIDNLTVKSGLDNVNIELSKDTTVKEISLDSAVTVKGEGTIKEATGSNAKDSSFENAPDSISAPSAGGGGGGGGGGGFSPIVKVSDINVTPTELTLTVGEKYQIAATVSPSNAANKKVFWTSDNEEVATVDEDGRVTALAVGNATITATTEDGGKKATCMLIVSKVFNITKQEDYDTIQEAIDDAASEDIIKVGAGTYHEAIAIGKSLTLLGINAENDARLPDFTENGSIVNGGIRITGKDVTVTIKGLTITTKGILAYDIASLTVVNSLIKDISKGQERDYLPSIIGIDVIDATEPIVIKNNVISNIGVDNGEGMGIRIMRASDDIIIADNIIKDLRHNGINVYQRCLTEKDAQLIITGNEINNWDSDKDNNNIGGRAIRIEFDGSVTEETVVISENKLIPPIYNGQSPVDSEYIKLTHVGIKIDLTKNYWGSATPNFDTILLVDGASASDCVYLPYYVDKTMTELGAPTSLTRDGSTIYYKTIDEAITNAMDGDIVKIGAGTYKYANPLEINDISLTLIGTDGAIIEGGVIARTSGSGKEITISGLEFRTAGLEVDGYDNVEIINNTFNNITSWTQEQLEDDSADAIYVHGSETGKVFIKDNTINGVKCSTTNVGDGMGITVLDLDNIEITRNTIIDTWHNSINIFRNVTGDVIITNNTLSNWDSNQDQAGATTITPGCEGGRALRIELAGDAQQQLTITGNTFDPNNNVNPVDPNYVKITRYAGDVANLIVSIVNGNHWPEGTDYSKVLLVNETYGPGSNAIMMASVMSDIAKDCEGTQEIDISSLEAAIQSALAAKENVAISEDGTDVPAGTCWVTQEDMDALEAAIAMAEAAVETAETQQDVVEAVEALEGAIAAFNDAKREAIDKNATDATDVTEGIISDQTPECDGDPGAE